MNEMLNSGLNKIGSSSFPEFCKIVVDNRDGLQENKYRQFTGGAFKKAERSGKLQPLEPDTVSAVVGKVYEAFLSFSFFLCFSSPFRAAVLTPSGFLVPLRAYFFFKLLLSRCVVRLVECGATCGGSMKISLNGKQVEVKSRTLERLISERGLHPDALIVEVNSELIKKENWAETIIRDGDTLELLNFVGGG